MTLLRSNKLIKT